jgi:serine/threonine protein kinase
LISEKGEIKLADFGNCGEFTNSKKISNSLIGTPYWMSPEVIKLR